MKRFLVRANLSVDAIVEAKTEEKAKIQFFNDCAVITESVATDIDLVEPEIIEIEEMEN